MEPTQLPIQLVPRLLPEGKVAGALCSPFTSILRQGKEGAKRIHLPSQCLHGQLYPYLRGKSNLSDPVRILVTPISNIYHRQYFCTDSGNHTNLLNYRLQDVYQSFSSYDKWFDFQHSIRIHC